MGNRYDRVDASRRKVLKVAAAEMLMGGVGIGFFIWDAWNSSLISDIIVALIYVGIIGFLLDRAFALLGRFVTHGTASTFRRGDTLSEVLRDVSLGVERGEYVKGGRLT